MRLEEYIATNYGGVEPSAEMPGVYILGFLTAAEAFEPTYVGRGDSDVAGRAQVSFDEKLLEEKRALVSHVIYRAFSNAREAYDEECRLFHALTPSRRCLNQMHPARPVGSDINCPVSGCAYGD